MELHMVMVRVHGVVMTVAFSIFGVIGIFFAAWMKPVLTQNSWWFKVSEMVHTRQCIQIFCSSEIKEDSICLRWLSKSGQQNGDVMVMSCDELEHMIR